MLPHTSVVGDDHSFVASQRNPVGHQEGVGSLKLENRNRQGDCMTFSRWVKGQGKSTL